MEFAKYKPTAGFKFSVDGIHKCPVRTPCVAIYCRNPDGEYYQNTPKTDEIHLVSALDWNSPAESPRFNDGFYTYKNVAFEPNMHIIVDIQTIIFGKTKKQYKIKNVGWTIVPVFDKRQYVKSGIYQMPLFKGKISTELVEALKEEDPWDFITDLLKRRKIKLYKPCSVIVRLLDS